MFHKGENSKCLLSFSFYLITLLFECLDSSFVDVFQKKNLDFRCIERTKHLGFRLTKGATTRSSAIGSSSSSSSRSNIGGGSSRGNIVDHNGKERRKREIWKKKKCDKRRREVLWAAVAGSFVDCVVLLGWAGLNTMSENW